MVEVIVEYDYDAAQEDELTLRIGDVIKNVRKLEEEGWCEGELNGKRGLFPDNFVKEVKRDTDAKEENQVSKREKPGNVANLVQRMSTIGLPIGFPSQPRSLRRRRSKKRHCEATFDYIPQNEDELEIKMGDVIEIIEEVEEGWWRGILNEKTGLFPSNFVKELIDQNENGETDEVLSEPDVPVKDLIGLGPSSPTSPLDSTGNENSTGTAFQPKKIRGLGFGDIFKEGSVKLKSRASNSESEDKKSEKQSIPASNTEIVKNEPENKRKGEYCKAVFAYEATNPDELSIKEGDHILLISKDTGDRGWWKGELNGKEGVFPDNFVVMISETGREVIAAPKAPSKLPPKPDLDDKPKKPLPPTKVQVSKPEPSPAEKKIELKKVHPDKIDMVTTRTDEKDDQKSTRPSAPMVPPKKPNLPMKHHPFKSATPPKRPEKPTVPPPLTKVNGEVPCNRPKPELDSAVFKPKSETGNRPKSTEIVFDKAFDIDLISFDTVESSSEKLTHPTASRPRLPGRRPPSVFMVLGDSHLDKKSKSIKEDDEEETAKPKPEIIKKVLGDSHLDKKSKSIKEDDEEETAKPKPSEIIKKPSFKQNTGIMNATEVKEMSEVDDRSKTTIEDVKAQIADLMTLVEKLKIQHNKDLIELRLEFEEEKKHRISLQLEVDKLKKAVQPP